MAGLPLARQVRLTGVRRRSVGGVRAVPAGRLRYLQLLVERVDVRIGDLDGRQPAGLQLDDLLKGLLLESEGQVTLLSAQ